MRISETGLALIARFEGFVPHVYKDAAGLATIGYGHLLLAGEAARYAQGIDQAEARVLLQQDVRMAEHAVLRLIVAPFTQGQFDALVSFTFNLGAGTLQRSTLRRVINRGCYDEAPAQFLRYVWAGGRQLPGLLRRRRAEVALFQAA